MLMRRLIIPVILSTTLLLQSNVFAQSQNTLNLNTSKFTKTSLTNIIKKQGVKQKSPLVNKENIKKSTVLKPFDSELPLFAFNIPFAPGSKYFETNENNIILEGSINNGMVQNVVYTLNNTPDKNAEIITNSKNVNNNYNYKSPLKWKISLQNLPDGINTLKIKAIDVNGNVGKDSVSILKYIGNENYAIKDDALIHLNEKKILFTPVYYSQVYGPWSSYPYYPVKRGIPQDGRTISINGCGPASTAMIISTLVDKRITPASIARFSMAYDCINSNYDTESKLFSEVAKQFGLEYEHTDDISYIAEYLEHGKHFAIASMGSGHFAPEGHIIALMGTIRIPGENFKRIIIHDPDTGNTNYGNDGAIILSQTPGIVYAKPKALQNEQSMGFWLFWK